MEKIKDPKYLNADGTVDKFWYTEYPNIEHPKVLPIDASVEKANSSLASTVAHIKKKWQNFSYFQQKKVLEFPSIYFKIKSER